jgi:hypothetical protein
MIMSVSTLMIFSGAATPSSVVNLSITVPGVPEMRRWRKVRGFVAKSGRRSKVQLRKARTQG